MTSKPKIIRAFTVSMSLCFIKDILPKLSDRYEVILLSSNGPELEEYSNSPLAKAIPLEMNRRISIREDVKSLWKLIKVFRKEKPYMVHSMTPKAGLLCMMAARITRVPIRIHTFTGLVFPTATGITRRILMMTDRITCFCATHVIPEGEGVKNDLLSNHITRKPIKVLGYGNIKGVDMDRFSLREEILEMAQTIKDPNLFTFLYVGRIVKDKGVEELCEAFAKINQKHPHSRLILVGDFEDNVDPISPQSRELIHKTEAIKSVGPKYSNELLAYYAASDCFILPSYREGFPNTVLEAGAMGLPCIVTDINGSREIIHNGENGLIVPPQNAESLAEAMDKILTNRDLTSLMASKARNMIGNRFEQSFVQQCLLDFYESIMK